MRTFRDYHPIVNVTYFVLVLLFSMLLMHPLCLAVSLVCSVGNALLLKGRRAMRLMVYLLPMMLISALMNLAFNHQGVTILAYLPSGNPLTLESAAFGVAAAAMLAAVICWFSCYNEVMTSDKFIYLFGRIIPSLSLVFSMALRFVPRLGTQLTAIANAQRCIGRDAASGRVVKRAKHGLGMLSILVTWSLEHAIDTADSMKSRGYGLPGRTAFSLYSFGRRDIAALACIVGLGLYVAVGALLGGISFRYFPSMDGQTGTAYAVSVAVAYLLLCCVPVILQGWEAWKWKAIKSNI